MNGRTDGYKPIMIDDASLEIGDFVRARVTGHEGHWLVGERIAE
jgi:tRNA A37 methylthiotransferase MiaB